MRAQFENEIEEAKKLLDSTRSASGLSPDETKPGTQLNKEKLGSSNISKKIVSKNNFLVIKDLDSNWQHLKRDLNSTCSKLKPLVDPTEANSVNEKVDAVYSDYDQLKDQLTKAYEKLEKTEDLLEENIEKRKQLADEVDELEELFRELPSIGRDPQTLEEQLEETEKFIENLDEKTQQAQQLMLEWKSMSDEGLATPSQLNQAQKELGRSLRQLDRQKNEAANRKRAISSTLDKIGQLEK